MGLRLRGVAEHTADLCFERRKYYAIKEGVKTDEDNATNYYADDDFNSGVDIALTRCGCESGLGLNCEGIELAHELVKKFFHDFKFPFKFEV